MKYVGDFEENLIACFENRSMKELESTFDIVSKCTNKNITTHIHLDHDFTFVRDLFSTTNIQDTPMSEKDLNSLIARHFEQ